MKLTQPDLMIKCKYAHIKTLYDYLIEIINNSQAYFKPCNISAHLVNIYKHNLSTLCEKAAKLMFKYVNERNKNFSVKLNEAERMSLFFVASFYPLPMDINFIEYEINKGLLK